MGMQSLLDHHLGRILDELDELGIADNTLVVYTSDHGEYMGDHWLWSKGGSHYDQAVRVPFIVRWPGVVPAGCSSDSLQSLIDLPTTFVAAAGVERIAAMQGVNQIATWQNPDQPTRTGVLIDHRVERGLYVSSWITQRYRLSHHAILAEARDEMELYDFENDPWEFNNLALDSSHDSLVRQLASEMMRYRRQMDRDWPNRGAGA
jgi:uncharacterized sulfatase